jgi:hypothetical protein
MVKELPIRAPNVDPAVVLVTGATELKTLFSGDDLAGILDAYMEGLRVPFIMCIAAACVALVIAFTPRWENLKGKVDLGAAAG